MKHVQKMDVTNYEPNPDLDMVAIYYDDEPDTADVLSDEPFLDTLKKVSRSISPLAISGGVTFEREQLFSIGGHEYSLGLQDGHLVLSQPCRCEDGLLGKRVFRFDGVLQEEEG